VWFDAANMPLVCGLDASFFEPGRRDDTEFWKVDEGDERLWAAAGMKAADAAPADGQYPKYRYPGVEAKRLLDALPAARDGAKLMRYVNPLTGGPVMPMLDCYRQRLAAGAATQAQRTTWNRICLVVDGEGRSTIGERTVEWTRHDVFTIPHWTWASHAARGGDAELFIVSDYAVFDAMGLLREERQ
jgi:gentisate 1,2-dioxygenase